MISRWEQLLKAVRYSGHGAEKTIHLDTHAGPVNMKLYQNRDGTVWVDGIGKPGQEAADEPDHDYIGTVGQSHLRRLKREIEQLPWPSKVKAWQGYRATGSRPGRIATVPAEGQGR
jgi:hypothetical protein